MPGPPAHEGLRAVTPDRDVDAVGLLCPLPVLRARKTLNAMASAQILRIRTSDPVAVIDIPHFCAEAGHRLVSSQADGDTHVFVIERGQSKAD